jgi:hypothetical protein
MRQGPPATLTDTLEQTRPVRPIWKAQDCDGDLRYFAGFE